MALDTAAALNAQCLITDGWMEGFEPGRSWSLSVTSKITTVMLYAAEGPLLFCKFKRDSNGDSPGVILRVSGQVWLIRL